MAYFVHICRNVKLAPIPFKKGRTRINLMGDMIPLLSYYYSESKNRKIVHFFIKDQLKSNEHEQFCILPTTTYFLDYCTIFEFLNTV